MYKCVHIHRYTYIHAERGNSGKTPTARAITTLGRNNTHFAAHTATHTATHCQAQASVELGGIPPSQYRSFMRCNTTSGHNTLQHTVQHTHCNIHTATHIAVHTTEHRHRQSQRGYRPHHTTSGCNTLQQLLQRTLQYILLGTGTDRARGDISLTISLIHAPHHYFGAQLEILHL